MLKKLYCSPCAYTEKQQFQARVGRVKQRALATSPGIGFSYHFYPCHFYCRWLTHYPLAGYGNDGSRLVAGVVAVSMDRKKVLVVESTRRDNHWVLPKGGYETDEATPEDAASRE